MHLITDENGNMIPHGHDCHEAGEHCHEAGEHCHKAETDGHDAPHCHERVAKDPKAETVALLGYMVTHNAAHAQELDTLADRVEAIGFAQEAKQIREAVSDFQKGNVRLSAALAAIRSVTDSDK